MSKIEKKILKQAVKYAALSGMGQLAGAGMVGDEREDFEEALEEERFKLCQLILDPQTTEEKECIGALLKEVEADIEADKGAEQEIRRGED